MISAYSYINKGFLLVYNNTDMYIECLRNGGRKCIGKTDFIKLKPVKNRLRKNICSIRIKTNNPSDQKLSNDVSNITVYTSKLLVYKDRLTFLTVNIQFR